MPISNGFSTMPLDLDRPRPDLELLGLAVDALVGAELVVVVVGR